MSPFESDFQDAKAVASRALCLGAIFLRGETEQAVLKIIAASPEEGRQNLLREHLQLVQDLKDWMSREVLWPLVTEDEQELWDTNLGQWPKEKIIDISWKCEAAGVLLWALGYYDEIPRYDKEFDTEGIFAHLGILRPATNFIQNARLRSSMEIDRIHTIAELWHWRAKQQLLIKNLTLPQDEIDNLILAIQDTARIALENGDLSDNIGNDFPVFDRPYRSLNEREFLLLFNITRVRYDTLNWLTGVEGQPDDLTSYL